MELKQNHPMKPAVPTNGTICSSTIDRKKLRAFRQAAYDPVVKLETGPTPPLMLVNTYCSTESSHTCIGENHPKYEEAVIMHKEEKRYGEEVSIAESEAISGGIGRWTDEEHRRFVEALEKYGKNWKKIQEYVGTRSTTQARSHAQKYFSRIEKSGNSSREIAAVNRLEGSRDSRITIPLPKSRSAEENDLPIGIIPEGKNKGKIRIRKHKPGRTQIRISAQGKIVCTKRLKPDTPVEGCKYEEIEPENIFAHEELQKPQVQLEWELQPELKFDNFEGELVKPLELCERKMSGAEFYHEDNKGELLIDLGPIFNPINNKSAL